jgi:hypothetical protein
MYGYTGFSWSDRDRAIVELKCTVIPVIDGATEIERVWNCKVRLDRL